MFVWALREQKKKKKKKRVFDVLFFLFEWKQPFADTDLNLEPEESAGVVQQNATRREAQDMGRILQRLLKEGTPLLHSVLVDYNIPGIFYLSKNLFVGAICVSTRRQVTSSRIQRRYIYDSNLAFGKFYFFYSLFSFIISNQYVAQQVVLC